MNGDGLKEIIDFAVKKEQEAADFYNDLSGKVELKALAEELLKMARVEESHRDRLRNMDVSAYVASPVKPPIDLKIADYLIDKEPTPEMSWQDLVHIAMKRELASMRLYTDLAKGTSDPQARRLFENLAVEEEAHKLYFEKIWDEEIMTDN
ncbi:MAG: ferritin family protein [Thermodesulfobacteriota bacterium]|nr:ferritin family protein [Thermodesulfobacteriota bacterium]